MFYLLGTGCAYLLSFCLFTCPFLLLSCLFALLCFSLLPSLKVRASFNLSHFQRCRSVLSPLANCEMFEVTGRVNEYDWGYEVR